MRCFKLIVSDDLAMFTPENIKQFDAIVLNNASGPWITPTATDMEKEALRKLGSDAQAVETVLRKSFLDFVENGGGVVSIHFAIAANRHWPEFKELFGATFTGHPWNEEVGVTVEEPDHPLVAAFDGKDFRIADEIYQYGPPYDRAQVRVLMSIDPARTNMGVRWIRRKDNDFALSWVKAYEKGRVFNTSFGHRSQLYSDPQVLQFYLDAIQFADPAELLAIVQPEQWNDYTVVAKGGNVVLNINGVTMCELDDRDPKRLVHGWLALQVHVGSPMRVQFKDIYLRRL